MLTLRPLTLLALSAALVACPAKDDEPTDDTDTDVEDTDTDVEDTDDTDEDTDTDTDVTFVPEPCEAEGVAETRVILDPTTAETEFFGGGAAQGGFPIPIPESSTTWFVRDNTGGTVTLDADTTHRFVVEFDPAIELSRAASYSGVDLVVGGNLLRMGGEIVTDLEPTIVREGTMTHDEASGSTSNSGRIDLDWEEDPGTDGGSAAQGDTLTCVAWEFTPAAGGSYSFGRVEFRMPESGDTRSAANPFQPLPPEM